MAFAAEFLLALKIYARTRFRILQACNPPDTIFLIALFFKLSGVRFVFDHHDPTPEFYTAKFQPKGLIYRLALLAERLSFRVAAVTISTNETLREMALARNGASPESSFVVRTCPDLDDFPQQSPRLELKRCVRFTGTLYGADLQAYLATVDLGVAPDPANVFNDKLTMIKILEYMAYGMPVVICDLPEGRYSAGEAALYAGRNDPRDFAQKIAQLLDSKSLRDQLGRVARRRIVEKLNWAIERQTFLKA